MRHRLLALLERCRMPDGGYCTFRDPESGGGFSNIADTCHALSLFSKLGIDPPALDETVRWIEAESVRSPVLHRSPALHWRLKAMGLAGLPWPETEGDLFARELDRLLGSSPGPGETFDLIREVADLLRLRDSPPLESGQIRSIRKYLESAGEGRAKSSRPATLPELEDRVVLMEASGLFSREEILQEREKEEGFRHRVLGWILTPESTASDLFVLRAGWRLSGGAPRDPWLVRVVAGTVRACQGREGGFAPIPGAAPNLAATDCALDLPAIRALAEP